MFNRRRFLIGSTLLALAAPLAAACGGGATSAPPAKVEEKKPDAAAKPADVKVSDAVAKTIPPTPTPVPQLTPIPQAAGTTKLLMRVHWSGGRFNDFATIINGYNEKQGPADKTYMALERFVAGQAGPIGTFIADFQAGTQEDIYHLSDAYLADLASRNFFSPPPKEIQGYIKEAFLPSAVATGTIDGNIMGHPTENQPHMIFLNKKMFTEVGLDAEKSPPKTWEDIRRMAKQLTKKDASGAKTQAGWIYHNNPGDGERPVVQRVIFQFLAGAPLVTTTDGVPKWDVTSEAARQFTELLYNIAQDGSMSQDMGPQNVIWPQRKGAMVSHDAWSVIFHVIAEGVPGLIDEQHTIPVMSPDGSKNGNMSRNYHFTVSSKSKYKELAWKHLEWLNHGPDYRMQDFQTNKFGFVPSVKNYPMPKPFPEQMKKAFLDSMATPHQTGMPVIKGMAECFSIMRDNTDALVLGKMNPKEYTEKLDGELKKAMQNAYGK
jgi:ABC-type glycerol-3-phosphate transport system substrate-binding protein